METTLTSYILQALDEIYAGQPSSRSVDFDLLVRVVTGKMRASDLQNLRHFGARVDSVVAGVLAPLTETGDVIWEPQSRRVAISDFGLLLLRSTASPETAPRERLVEQQAVLR